MAPSIGRAMLHIRGFYIAPGSPFNNAEVASRIYAGLLGDERESIHAKEAQKLVGERVEDLFKICREHFDVYEAQPQGNTEAFWNLISTKWHNLNELKGKDIQKLVSLFTNARKAYNGSSDSKLTRQVDRWATQVREHDARLSSRGRRGDVLPHEKDPTPATRKWPHADLSPQEREWVLDTRIRDQVFGLKPGGDGALEKMKSLLPIKECTPVGVLAFHAAMGLTLLTRNQRWALIMPPIALWDKYNREDWHRASGGWSYRYWTLKNDFIPYAHSIFKSGNRSIVFGVFSYWKGSPSEHQEALRRVEIREDPSVNARDSWYEHSRLNSIAIALVRPVGSSNLWLVVYYPPGKVAPKPTFTDGGLQAVPQPNQLITALNSVFEISEVFSGSPTVQQLVGESPTGQECSTTTSACAFTWSIAAGIFDPTTTGALQAAGFAKEN